MVFFKKVEVRCQKDRYGGTQRGLFALEKIEKGEKVWFCECGEKDGSFTRQQLLDIIEKHPRLDYFIRLVRVSNTILVIFYESILERRF